MNIVPKGFIRGKLWCKNLVSFVFGLYLYRTRAVLALYQLRSFSV